MVKIGILLLALSISSCDREGRKQCAWELEPEPKLKEVVDTGFVPVCARNRHTMKQDCRLQTTLGFAKEVWGRQFRYEDLKIVSVALPRTVKKITFCDSKGGNLAAPTDLPEQLEKL